MSFDLCVWRENQPVTAARALRTYRWLCDDQRVGDPDGAELSIVADARVDRFHRELMGVYPPLEELGTQAGEASPWSMTPRHEHGLFAVMTMGFAHATAVAPVIVEMALRHGLVCFDPRQGEIHNPPEIVASDGPRLEFRDGGVVNNPHPGALPALLGQVTERNWFAILEHEPGWFMQVGVGEPAGGLDDGVYGLEFREGSEDRHFRVLVSDFGAMARAFQDYVTGDQRWKSVFDWQPLAPPTVDLAFWHAARVPNPTEAEEYYQRIRTDDHPVPLGVLAPPLREFVRGVGEDIPQAEILPLDRSQDEPLYSRLGIAVRVPARDLKEVCPRLVATAIDLRLLTYDRDGGYVMGM